MNKIPSGKSWNASKLDLAKQLYNLRNYKSAYNLFKKLTSEIQENYTHDKGIEIYGTAIYYIVLCNLYGKDTEKNEVYTLSITNYLGQKQQYNDALKIYDILFFKAESDKIKSKAS
ncbi:18753_t:CDS:1 [Racocetra persica]|uniref:18753_t:CDS:1 n=1 Tax=Racocetra persica TaxID=160502 RepID=A0ACA9M5Z9_9GLOM|nr:18753_t:CDS:1 [Racocetra persica]